MREYMPTENQKKVFAKVKEQLGKSGKVSISKAMRDSKAYSKNVSKTPSNLTKTKGWQYLMDKYMPEEKLSTVHDELLNSKLMLSMVFGSDVKRKDIEDIIKSVGGKLVRVVNKETLDDILQIAYYSTPNTITIDKALDKAYKLRGLYAPEKKQVDVTGFSLAQLASGEYDEESD